MSEKTVAERFESFHNSNPAVYRRLVELCREYARAGHSVFGIRQPLERLRWDLVVRTYGNEARDFKINDHMAPYYSRLIIAQEPDLAHLLRLRRAEKADEWIEAKFPGFFDQQRGAA